ncbi:MAG TPA: HAMP domain-containing sensor histidine kinase [Thermoanaerobaculia bacterium]|nr:HAMP domain-containing sensor histidine kinase [Thermoanaerobaculia bacterium]
MDRSPVSPSGARLPWLVLALVAAVVATAAVQVRWLERLAVSEREMLRRMVEAESAQLSQALTRDLARIVDHFTRATQDMDWTRRVREWNSATDRPVAVHAVYRVRTGEDPGVTLLAGLPVDAAREKALMDSALAPSPFDWEATALRLPEHPGHQPSWIIVALDRNSFRHPYLSDLIDRHISRKELFDVVVERAKSRRIVFTSTRADIRAKADAVIDLFDPSLYAAWTMYIRHRAGSIGDAVEATRRKGLAMAAVTMLLLLASAVALIRTARSAQALAYERAMFASMITHELLTPLTVIRSASEALAGRFIADPERVRRFGRVIHDEGLRLNGIITRVLDLSTSDVQVTRTRIDVASVVRDTVANFKEVSGAPSALVVDAPESLVAAVDPTALERILFNLLDNAAKYGTPGRQVVIRLASEGRALVLSVANEGEVLSPRERRRLFEPFFRGRHAATADQTGKGLGLAIVRALTRAHGGTVTMEFAGNWIVFTVTLLKRTG